METISKIAEKARKLLDVLTDTSRNSDENNDTVEDSNFFQPLQPIHEPIKRGSDNRHDGNNLGNYESEAKSVDGNLLEVQNKNSEWETKSNPDAIFQKVLEGTLKFTNIMKKEDERRDSEMIKNLTEIPEEIQPSDWDSKIKRIHEFIEHSSNLIRVECYYWTKYGKIKGMLTMKDEIIVFDPLKWEENDKFIDTGRYHCFIDLNDIWDAQVLKIPNETAQYIKNEQDRQWYIYDYYLQLALSTVNGETIKRLIDKKNSWLLPHAKKKFYAQSKSKSVNPEEIKISTDLLLKTESGNNLEPTKSPHQWECDSGFDKKAEKKAIALAFFRFSHRDKDGTPLSNQQQADIVDNIYQNIYVRAEKTVEHEYSSTFVPFYDSLLDTDKSIVEYSPDVLKKKARAFDHIHDDILSYEDWVLEEKPARPSIPKKMLSLSIPTFSPFSNEEKSNIISETQAIMIGRLLPPIIRMREWERLYSIDVDGVSLSTFYKNMHGHTATILIFQDTNNYKFGWYAASDWEVKKHYYGTGESFLFTFKDTEEEIKVYKWSGVNDYIQYSDESSLGMGGQKGKFSLFIRKNFYYGSSHKWETFNNEILSSSEDFECTKFEVWGFDCY